jgi:hypothetical protein
MPLLSRFRTLLGVTRNGPDVEALEVAPDPFVRYRNSPDKLLRNFEILSRDMGQLNTMMLNLPVDANDRPLPWYTYPAIEYLRQFDFTDKHIFEFGCGNSSLFWLEMGATVWSVEHDRAWHDKVSGKSMPRHTVYFADSAEPYVGSIELPGQSFDVVVIDGQWREACVSPAIARLKPGGFIILDNADRDHDAADALRARDFFEVDFNGFGPINDYTWTTALFLPPGGAKLRIAHPPSPIGGHPSNRRRL